MTEYTRALVWFRRDLRDYDHAALYHALKRARQVVCVFCLRPLKILDALPDPADRRVELSMPASANCNKPAGEGRWPGGQAWRRARRDCAIGGRH